MSKGIRTLIRRGSLALAASIFVTVSTEFLNINTVSVQKLLGSGEPPPYPLDLPRCLDSPKLLLHVCQIRQAVEIFSKSLSYIVGN